MATEALTSNTELAQNYKLVVVGDGCVGKTSLLTRFRNGHFPYDYIPTVFDQSFKDFSVDDEPAALSLWDTAGQEEFARTRPLTYPYTDIFLLCFSVSDPTSFYNIKLKWWPEVQRYCPKATLILVGTKQDTRVEGDLSQNSSNSRALTGGGSGQSMINADRGRALAKELKMSAYKECSALKDINVQEVFDAAIRARRNEGLRKSDGGKKRSLKCPSGKCAII